MDIAWPRLLPLAVVVSTLLLVTAGALVTSNDAALSIPDWPLAWGKLIPPFEGGIRSEFVHRLLAAIVGGLTLALALRERTGLAWAAFGTVLAQALLGAALVKFIDPKSLAIIHACLAQLTFGLVVALWGGIRSRGPVAGRPQSLSLAPVLAAAALFIQTVLGAAVRHSAIGPVPHFAWAAVAVIAAMWASLQVLARQMEETALRRSAMLLLSFTFSQIFIGMGAYMGRVMNADAPQPLAMMVGFTVAHVAVGSLAFGSAVALAMRGGMLAA